MGFCGLEDNKGPELLDYIDCFFKYTTFYNVPIINVPLSIVFAIVAAVYFLIKLDFAPIRLFKHAIDVVKDKYTNKKAPGSLTPKEAIFAAALGTVGLGSVGGMAAAVAYGGPGAVFWVVVAGIVVSTLKFAEVALGHKFRTVDEKEGTASGSPFEYMRKSFEYLKMPKTGVFIGKFYGFVFLLATFFTVCMFQCGQTIVILESNFDILKSDMSHWIIGSLVTALVGIAISGGLEGMSKIANKLVPFMTISYVISAIVIIIVNGSALPSALSLIMTEAFNTKAMTGGLIGGIVQGTLRAIFTSESGSGTSAISHSSAKTEHHIMEGCTGFIEVLFPLTVCFLTGLIVVITGAYSSNAVGVGITSNAFASVASWFPYILTIQVPFLAITTVITWGVYGDKAWTNFFGNTIPRILFKVLFLICALSGFVLRDQTLVLRLADYSWLSLVVPNVILLLLMRNVLKKDMVDYISKIKSGDIAPLRQENK